MMRIAAFSLIAALLAVLAVVGWFSQERELMMLSEQISLVVVGNSSLQSKETSALQTELATVVGVDSVRVKSANDVRNEFVSRFATSVSNTLNENPFPTMWIVRLKEEARTKERMDTIAAEIRTLTGVADVSYRAAFVSLVGARMHEARIVRWTAGTVVLIALITLLWAMLDGIQLQHTGLQTPAIGILLGSVLAGIFGIGLFYLLRPSLPSLDAVRPVSLLAGSAIVCALGGIILGIHAVLIVKNTPIPSPPVTNPPQEASSSEHE